jgi:hypothetical protein
MLLNNIGRQAKISYGTGAVTEFRIAFPTVQSPAVLPTAGTLTIAGVTVTLTASDILSPIGVAQKIASTSIAGYTVYSKKDIVYLTNTTVNSITKATYVLGTATNILFVDSVFTSGTPIGTIGAMDDVLVTGRTPVTVTVAFTGGTLPTIQASTGTPQEQATGTLTYATAVTLVGQAYTFTTPVNYIRMTTQASNTQAILYITR